MKILKKLLLLSIIVLPLAACSCKKEESNKIEYTHYNNVGAKETLEADILWEYKTSAFTKYQVAYTSYVCSDATDNYKNIIYIEITNLKTKDDSVIRKISFTTNTDEDGNMFDVGVWGDYKYAHGKNFYEVIESQILPNLEGKGYNYITNLANKGYRGYTSIDDIDSDAIAGGTNSASNVVSIVKAIYDYHIEKYY